MGRWQTPCHSGQEAQTSTLGMLKGLRSCSESESSESLWRRSQPPTDLWWKIHRQHKKEVDSGELSLAKASCIPPFITHKKISMYQLKKGSIKTWPKNSSTNQFHNEIFPQYWQNFVVLFFCQKWQIPQCLSNILLSTLSSFCHIQMFHLLRGNNK